MAPSTFASAAAGNASTINSARDATSDWSRRTNGATQTFRRPSGAAATPVSTPTAVQQQDGLASHPPRYVPPHRNGTLPDSQTRYSKEQMLELFRMHASSDSFSDDLPDLFVAGWQPDVLNGSTSSWSRSDYGRETQTAPEACWDATGSTEPLGLIEMDEEERDLFTTSVNSPIKPPIASKENNQANGLPSRRISISNNASSPGGFGLPSPNITRGSARRRETSESFPFPLNGVSSASTFSREDLRTASPPPALIRRRTDHKESRQAEDTPDDGKPPSAQFGSLRRHPTGPLSAGFTAPSSPWSTGPQSAGLPAMGSFGNFGMVGNATQQAAPGEKRSVLGGGRSESRFKNLLNKESNEDVNQRSLERKTSISSLARVNENESWRTLETLDTANHVLDENDELFPTGSAALAADADKSPPNPRQGYHSFGTPSRPGAQDDIGFGAFGMTSDNVHGFTSNFLPGRDASLQQTPAQHRTAQQAGNEPKSPTGTNPYQSPEQHGQDGTTLDNGDVGLDMHSTHLPGLGQFGAGESVQAFGGLGGGGPLANLGRHPGAQISASDRSQTSSVGGNRAFAGLGGFGQLGSISGAAAWPVSQGGLGTPSRPTAGLSNPSGGTAFSSNMGDLQSPNLTGLGGIGGGSGGGNSTLGLQSGLYGASRMASMFPHGLQESMHQGSESDRDIGLEHHASGFPGSGDFGRSSESTFNSQANHQSHELKSQSDMLDAQQAPFGAPGQQSQLQEQQSRPPNISASNQPPAPQQRTMVMPDRMRWIYRDPQGQTQGPWTGLEMHDWYKAGFFSPELLVKKFEDPDYEPLAQLIRRIGNSREPFLVPQIGIAHGVATSTGPNAWAGSGPVAASSGGAQPPFASSFPSFGTTLTAEQQNALERRKQEEQYLMARQKEHLAQAQIAQRMQLQGGNHPSLMPSQLHHHSSAHSLQSQPSFGSITSPTGYQPSPVQGSSVNLPQGQHQGLFDSSIRSPQAHVGGVGVGLGAVGSGLESLGRIREEEDSAMLNSLTMDEGRTGAGHFGAPGQRYGGLQQAQMQTEQQIHDQQLHDMLQDRARLAQEQAQFDAQEQSSGQDQGSDNRLQQFQQLQALEDERIRADTESSDMSSSQPAASEPSWSSIGMHAKSDQKQRQRQAQEPLSLREQVQQAASAQQSPAPRDNGVLQPFSPAPTQSPLPAPSAQRPGSQSVADHLQTESRDQSQTPSTETPSVTVAPWAKEPIEAAKGPTLRQIQEIEARKAAETEELAAAARRAAFQRELEAQTLPIVAQPGLPTTSTWGAGSPATPTGLTSAAWAKSTQKVAAPNASKTLAQIQKEEEARKRRQAAAVQQQAIALGVVSAPAGGKSYANLAGKPVTTPTTANVGNGTWTTVGAGGKSKTPGGAPAPVASRTVSAGVVPLVQVPTVRKPTARSNTMGNPGAVNAQDDFKKWAVNELRPDLNRLINAEEFVSGLLVFPPDTDIITEAVHGVSSTIDSRHFAEEFIRRKRLADKGLIDNTPPKSGSPSQAGEKGAGGWSQVAKKGPVKEDSKEEANGNFRVVPSKKKVGKR